MSALHFAALWSGVAVVGFGAYVAGLIEGLIPGKEVSSEERRRQRHNARHGFQFCVIVATIGFCLVTWGSLG